MLKRRSQIARGIYPNGINGIWPLLRAAGERAMKIARPQPGRHHLMYTLSALTLSGGLFLGTAAADQIFNGAGGGSVATGTVSLDSNSRTRACDYTSLGLGALTGSATCVMSVTYTGSIGAFMSLTVRIRSAAGSGGSPLYDGTNVTGLTMTISDGHNLYMVPVGPPTPCGGGFSCWTAANALAASYQTNPGDLIFRDGDTATFTLTPVFRGTDGSAYADAQADVDLSVQVVQAAANPLPSGCGASTIGSPCPASGTFTWS